MQIKSTMVKLGLGIAAAACLGALPAGAETMKLTAIGGSPPNVLPVKVTTEYFIPEVNRRLAATGKDFKIEWTEAYSSTLASFTEVFEAVEEGIGHLGVNIWVFEASKLPLENVTFYVPFGISDAISMTHVMRNLHKKIPEMNEAFLKYNQVHLVSWGSDPYQLATQFPVTKWEDVKGHKIGSSGTMGQFFRNTGAAVVTSNMGDAYTSLRSGVYEGYPAAIALIYPYKMHLAAKYITMVNFGATAGSGLTMNLDKWEELPDFAKEIFHEVARDTAIRYSTEANQRATKFLALIKKDGGVISGFSNEERKRWAFHLPNIAQEWAKRLDERGLPGTKLLEAYMDELRALPEGSKEIVRQWDRE